MKATSLQVSASGTGGRRGIALVSVLWVLVLLSLIAASFSRTSRTEVEFARNLVENAKAEALADAGVYRALIGLSEPLEIDRWLADGTTYEFELPDGKTRITIQDEVGKIDLNEGQDSLFQGLFTLAGVEPEVAWGLVDAIADFRDTDHLSEQRGAEDGAYEAAGLPHDAKDAPFESVEELRQVLGMSYDLYEKVAPMLTVHSRRPGFNPNLAPKEVLLAMPGVDAEKVDEFLTERSLFAEESGEAERQLEETVDAGDIGISKREERENRKRRSRTKDRDEESLADDGTNELLSILGDVPEISRFFTLGRGRGAMTVRVEARTPSGAVFVREALLQLGRGQPQNARFLAWRRGAGTSLLPEKDDAEILEDH